MLIPKHLRKSIIGPLEQIKAKNCYGTFFGAPCILSIIRCILSPQPAINMLHMIIPFAQAVGALFGMLGTQQSYIDDIGPPMLPFGIYPIFCKVKVSSFFLSNCGSQMSVF